MEKNLNLESDPNFVTRFYLSVDDSYSDQHYLSLCMRTSIFERILTKYMFQGATKNYSLRDFLTGLKNNPEAMTKFQDRMKLFQQIFKEEGPLTFFVEYSKELLRLLKEDFSKIKYEKIVLKTEFLLACHFENNFFEKPMDQALNFNNFENSYLSREKTNFNYSIGCLKTIFDFILYSLIGKI